MDLLEALGLSRPVADSACCFELYQDPPGASAAGSSSSSSTATTAAALDALRVSCMQLLQPHLDGYIWQHEPLRLMSSLAQPQPWLAAKGRRHPHEQQPSSQQQQQQQQPCLWGVLRYEDNVEDEWFLVWLLLELTAQLPGLTARVWDDDGEFLLIEAAYALPRWLKPETASNRVWLRSGQLHIVPPPSAKAPTLPASPSVADALAVLRGGSVTTRRKTVEAAVRERLAGYPGKAGEQLQRVVAWLPRRLAGLLRQDPQLVAGAVAAFMTRQREETQAACRFQLLPPADMTTALVSLNRCMFAQLQQADFAPPKGYPAPPGGGWLGGSSARQLRAVSLGLKLATGAEIMAARLGLKPAQADAAADAAAAAAADDDHAGQSGSSTAAGTQQQQGAAADSGLAANPAWQSYLSVLRSSGYFSGELEGSARYRQLLAAAQEAFCASEAFERSAAALAAPRQRLQQLLAAADDAAAPAAVAGAAGQPQLSRVAAVLDVSDATAAQYEDDDGWMAIEAEQLQQQLQQAEALAASDAARRQQRQQDKQEGAGGANAAASGGGAELDAAQLLSGLKGFVQGLAGPEGAEVPAAASSTATAAAAGGRPARGSAATRQQRSQAAAAGGSGAADDDGQLLDGDAMLSSLLGFLDAAYAGELPGGPQGGDGSGGPPADLMRQLDALQRQLEHAERMAAPLGELASDDYGSSGDSSDEGSSFYGPDSDDGTDGDGLDAAAAAAGWHRQQQQLSQPAMLPVPPPASSQPAGSRLQQQQQSQAGGSSSPAAKPAWRQKLQEWDDITAPDSDDEDEDDDDDGGLSLGGSGGSEEGDELSSTGGGDAAYEAWAAAAAGRGSSGAFLESYSTAMDAELAATTMAQTFERVTLQPPQQPGGGDGSSSGAAAAASAAAAADDAGLTPVDLDFNLIKSMVASFAAQGGLPGPASNLAGLLGLDLPTEMELVDDRPGGGSGGGGETASAAAAPQR